MLPRILETCTVEVEKLNNLSGAGESAQLSQSFSQNHEDLSLDPQNSHKKLGVAASACNTNTGEVAIGKFLLAHQSSQIGGLQAQ